MISDFQDLSDKIDQLAEMTAALRRENAQLRQANAALVAENMGYQRRWAKPPADSKPCWDPSRPRERRNR
jgi:regulator of replication initiation timing